MIVPSSEKHAAANAAADATLKSSWVVEIRIALPSPARARRSLAHESK
jgi:hypothetical protein